RKAYKNVKMIFQEARSSLDPRLPLGESIRDALRVSGRMTARECRRESERLLCSGGVDKSYDKAYPSNVSGGECQRAVIARAIATNPRLIVCDEATSALDVSVQAQILELLRELGEKNGTSFLFITHDLALVSGFCTRTYVMYRGEIAEHGKTVQIINNPQNVYTRKLISSVLSVGVPS
ncbi:MAG: ATP-binding cassette domain-containing protein, partial [Clostridiales bacterium]|nr:ATP-binding cassette domain-containing protein [Clostridiales bacterium]